jgi:hypothetical protein
VEREAMKKLRAIFPKSSYGMTNQQKEFILSSLLAQQFHLPVHLVQNSLYTGEYISELFRPFEEHYLRPQVVQGSGAWA